VGQSSVTDAGGAIHYWDGKTCHQMPGHSSSIYPLLSRTGGIRPTNRHDFQLFLAINDIKHAKTKAKSSQTNAICERFHKTILQEFYQGTFRKKNL